MLLIEHDMGLVLSICDRVVVLEFGRVIADDTPQAVRRDPRIIAAYLGTAANPASAEGAVDPASAAGTVDPASAAGTVSPVSAAGTVDPASGPAARAMKPADD
jgi:ABC-type glutathione transport system ATPase component